MKLSFREYREKVEGCWLGKNIGGTLGAPFECKRGVFDIDFYTQEPGGEPLPNDDLDLQLLWLNAVEKYGRRVNASTLGEYWLQYVTPNWAEYGAGKSNLRMGLLPPLSGYSGNTNRNSCGAFIRSEIWACLAPGHPEIAVQYAYEDAIVDHSHEGVYGEIFFAALESAAFVENDRDKLLSIGLSYIPGDCAVAEVIRLVAQSYRKQVDWKTLRKKILQEFPSAFGMSQGYENRKPEDDVPFGEIGYDAPANIGFTILGWLYGEGDWGNSLSLSVNCGEDADCSAATLGSMLGITHGVGAVPRKWLEPIGRNIKTLSLNLGDFGVSIPKTVDELTDRLTRLTPVFLGLDICDIMTDKAYSIDVRSGDNLLNGNVPVNGYYSRNFTDLLEDQPFQLKFENHLMEVILRYGDEPFLKRGEPFTFRLDIFNNIMMPQWLRLKWHAPEELRIAPARDFNLHLEHNHGCIGKTSAEFSLTAEQISQRKYEIVLDIGSEGRHSRLLIPITLLASYRWENQDA
jgi:ADP-ribosylglycohydrolase